MITDLLLIMFRSILDAMIFLLPNASGLPTEISSAVVSFAPYFSKANSFLPVSTVFSIMALVLVFESGILLFKILNWILNKLRGSG